MPFIDRIAEQGHGRLRDFLRPESSIWRADAEATYKFDMHPVNGKIRCLTMFNDEKFDGVLITSDPQSKLRICGIRRKSANLMQGMPVNSSMLYPLKSVPAFFWIV